MDLVEPALQSNSDPVVRMALKVLRHHPNRGEAIRRWQAFLTTPCADTVMCCLQEAQVYDVETIRLVREAALASKDERAHRAALAYFEAGVEPSPDGSVELTAAIGDFVYHRAGGLRLNAATLLDARGLSRWRDIVRGASADFDRLQCVADDEHEETIRTILTKKLPDDYEWRLRAILFARAKRKAKI